MQAFLFIAVSFLLFACNTIPKASFQTISIEKIIIAPGPEDMVLDTFFSQPRLIISSSTRRKNEKPFAEIMQYNLINGEKTILERKNDETKFFNPHGIDIREIGNTVWFYVISHNNIENKQEIISYKLYENHLEYVSTFTDSLIVSPNDLTIAPDASFYVTNDAKKRNNMIEKILAKRSSTIIHMHSQLNGVTKIATQNLAYANGILCLDTSVYISTTQRKELNEYSIQANGTLLKNKNLARIKGMDNISVYEDWLIVPAHLKFIKFIRHVSKSENKSPSVVYAINRKTGEQKVLFSDDG
ncbi:MAG: hypothetical protein ACK4ON_03315, partial [Bacteroidia bacterium]